MPKFDKQKARIRRQINRQLGRSPNDLSRAFLGALGKLLSRIPAPSADNSADWATVDSALRDRSFFSATVESTLFLDKAKKALADVIGARVEKVVSPDGTTSMALTTAGKAAFIDKVRDIIASEGMASAKDFTAERGEDITNIGGRRRLALVFDTQMKTAYGWADYEQSLDPEILAAFPASRFIRVGPVVEARMRHAATENEVRLKADIEFWLWENDPEIGGFGVPWGPFGYNSEMDTEDVGRSEAEALGLMKKGQQVPIPNLSQFGRTKGKRMNKGFSSPEPVDPGLQAKLRVALKAKYGDSVIMANGRVNLG